MLLRNFRKLLILRFPSQLGLSSRFRRLLGNDLWRNIYDVTERRRHVVEFPWRPGRFRRIGRRVWWRHWGRNRVAFCDVIITIVWRHNWIFARHRLAYDDVMGGDFFPVVESDQWGNVVERFHCDVFFLGVFPDFELYRGVVGAHLLHIAVNFQMVKFVVVPEIFY